MGGGGVNPSATEDAIADSRDALHAAFVAGSPPGAPWVVREYAGAGPWSDLAVLIGYGSPFLEPARDVRAPDAWRVRWGVILVAGRFDVEGSARALDTMVGYGLAAVSGMYAWEPPGVGGARMLEVSGGRYLTATLTASRVLFLC
jgi:hypothetical protein